MPSKNDLQSNSNPLSVINQIPINMIKKYTFLIMITFSSLMMSQNETCESPTDDLLLDANSITKCSIEEKHSEVDSNKRTKVFKVKVSSRRRVERKRKAVSSNLNMKTSNAIDKVDQNSSFSNSLDLESMRVNNSYLDNKKVIEKVPFNHVEEVPLFDVCKKTPILQQRKCFNKEINKHILNNLKYPEKSYSESIQGRVLVQFVIDKQGNVADLNIRVPYKGEELEQEAIRIIEKLPKFTPGKHLGKVVKVKYGIPINFKIPGRAPSNVKEKIEEVKLDEVYSFTNVDQIPTFKSCSKANNKTSDCFNQSFIDHINKHFAYPVDAIDNNIEGKVIAYFVIDTKGKVINIKTRAADGKEILEKATKELIKKLPSFTPGKQNGKVTNVKHAFPVMFKLEDG